MLTCKQVMDGSQGIASVASYTHQFHAMLHKKLQEAGMPVAVYAGGIVVVHSGTFTHAWDESGNLVCTWAAPKPVPWWRKLLIPLIGAPHAD